VTYLESEEVLIPVPWLNSKPHNYTFYFVPESFFQFQLKNKFFSSPSECYHCGLEDILMLLSAGPSWISLKSQASCATDIVLHIFSYFVR
jgi:hypothetical protein